MTAITRQTKYTTRNPISRFLLRGFFREISKLVARNPCEEVLEIGCGEGMLMHHLRSQLAGKRVFALDIEPADVATALQNSSFARYTVASAYALPFGDGQFGLTICCEVLEHLRAPQIALREIRRVTSGYTLLSVPNEPLWRVLNVLRGAYLRQWGNTPGHVNHWSPRAFQRLAGQQFRIIEAVSPLPWVAVLCAKQ